MSETKTIHRGDYRPFTHTVKSVELDIALDAESTLVRSRLTVEPREGQHASDLRLDGNGLSFEKLLINGAEALESRYSLTEDALIVRNISRPAKIEVHNRFSPAQNTQLSGIYVSGTNIMSQCESEGFRRITYYPDRPDVMSCFTVTIHADKSLYPVLLSNGNLVEEADEEGGRHRATWNDPFPKPSYLFALVAGRLKDRSEKFALKNGRVCLLQVWTEERNYERSSHALESLKKAIRWDEERFGLELDLDRFMIVATDDFNFGAMENKGLNVFNSRYVMAHPDIATDRDYHAIENVVGHEYFHNWTGDRVTLRDWFQLTLKEGLTSFRDQEFSMDMAPDPASRAVCRIRDIRALRASQFPEDAGPMAHPIRPESYQEISNFYTTTVYDKGAEVTRMLQTILGREGFRRGLSRYIEKHDGEAATCDDFIAAMAEANSTDLTAFSRWWGQAGTPRVTIETVWNAKDRTYTVSATQVTPPTAGQARKLPMVIPIAVGLVSGSGRDLPLTLEGEAPGAETTRVLELSEGSQSWTFTGVAENPVLSVGRGGSAPVIFEHRVTRSELAFLAVHDNDDFNRAESMEKLALKSLHSMINRLETGRDTGLDPDWERAFGEVLNDAALPAQFRAEALAVPDEGLICQGRDMIDPDSVHLAWLKSTEALGRRYSRDLERTVMDNQTPGAYSPSAADAGRRALKNLAADLWLAGGSSRALLYVRSQFETANNLTDRLAALSSIASSRSPAKYDLLAEAAKLWRDEPLLINKWLTIQALMPSYPGEEPAVERVKSLMQLPAFSVKNPNNVFALLVAFCRRNPAEFHRIDGSGYAFWKDAVLHLDPINPHVASRLARALDNWRRYEPVRSHMMYEALQEVAGAPKLSAGVREIVNKALTGI